MRATGTDESSELAQAIWALSIAGVHCILVVLHFFTTMRKDLI